MVAYNHVQQNVLRNQETDKDKWKVKIY